MGEAEPELLRRWAAGDRAALEALYRRYVERVWRYAWLRTRSRHMAEEIVQETFLRVARAAGQFGGRSAFGTWLFAVTRSVTIDQIRRARREAEGIEPGRVIRLMPPTESGEDEATRQAVRDAVAELPGAQRDVTVLCEVSGLSIREAGEVLGWGESRVKVTLFRARRRLRDMLRDRLGIRTPAAKAGAGGCSDAE